MRVRGAGRGWRTLSRLALIGVIGGGTAACSSDASRLSDPFTNPFSSSEPAATGSLPEGEDDTMRTPSIRTPRVQSQDLAAPSAIATPRPAATARVVAAEPIAGAVDGMNPGAPRAMTPRAAPAAPQPKLVFGKGPKGIEKPADRAAEAKREAESRREAEAKKHAEARKAAEAKHDAKHDGKHAEAKKSEPKKPVPKSAEKSAKPDAKEAEAKAAKAEAAKKVAEAKAAESAAKASARDSAARVSKQAALAPKEAEKPVAKAPEKAPEPTSTGSTASNDSFRWPAKGRVINGYGSSGNEGINIAVPEGTPVKAAEDGTVAYAGSDVKGYGKLVLVRHSNGYVSAYAHNGELDVRPGDKVKRGQVIAKSGATGNVTSPQLHFEIRKGATPVDPIPHLASN